MEIMKLKRRTREHIIAELSVNHVERFVLRCGYSTQRIQADYGVDLLIYTYNSNGFVELGSIPVQLKATDHLNTLKDGETIPIRLDPRDINFWRQEQLFLLILYDASEDVAYWVDVPQAIKQLPDQVLTQKSITLYLKKKNILNEAAIEAFATQKRRIILNKQQGEFHHEG
jgi:hypothetical protein